MIRGAFLSGFLTGVHHSQDSALTSLLKKAQVGGFRVTHVYPCYHQGWEMDEWGAIGTKDGQLYRLETNHDGLQPVAIGGMPFVAQMACLRFYDEEVASVASSIAADPMCVPGWCVRCGHPVSDCVCDTVPRGKSEET